MKPDGLKSNNKQSNKSKKSSFSRYIFRILFFSIVSWVLLCIIFINPSHHWEVLPVDHDAPTKAAGTSAVKVAKGDQSEKNVNGSDWGHVIKDSIDIINDKFFIHRSNNIPKKSIKVHDINVIAKSNSNAVTGESPLHCKNFSFEVLRPTHGCEVNKDTHMMYCNFENLKVDVSKIYSDPGGEPLASVMGRSEDKEMPKYDKGAFVTAKVPKFEVPHMYRDKMHYQKDVLNNLQYPTKANKGKVNMECTETWKGTTMFITRYEYVNLFHTLTDWFNTFLVIPPESSDIQIVFLDAHAEGSLDSVWSDVFGKYTYVKHLPEGGVCFEKAIFIPPGYVSPINDARFIRSTCVHRGLAKEFASFFLRSYNLEDVKPVKGKITIIDRQPYIAHPRSHGGKSLRGLENLNQLEEGLHKISGVTSIKIVRLETMSFRDQLELMRQSHIVIGNHGAGLSHIMFMDESSEMIEFWVSIFFFSYLSEWIGVKHSPVFVTTGARVLSQNNIAETAGVVKNILSH